MAGGRAIPLSRRLASPGGSALIGKTAEWITLAALLVFLPRLLGPSDYGWFAFALAVVTIGSASFSLGGPVLMARFLPAVEPAERAGVALALAARVARFRLVQIVAIVVAGVVFALAAPDRLPASVMAAVVIALAFDAATTLAYQIALGFGHTTAWSLRYPIQNAGMLVAATLLWLVWGPDAAVAGIPVGIAAALVVPVVLMRHRVRTARRGAVPERAMRFAVLQGLGGLLTQVCHRGPMIVVAVVTGSGRQSGFVALAVGSALAVITAVYQYFTVHLPGLASRVATGDTAVERESGRKAGYATAILTAIALATIPLVDWLLRHVVGKDFAPAADAFTPALAAVPFAAVTAFVVQVSALRLRADLRLSAAAVGAIAFCVVAGSTVPAHADVGAAWAFLAGTAATALVGAALLRDALPLRVILVAVVGSLLVLAAGSA